MPRSNGFCFVIGIGLSAQAEIGDAIALAEHAIGLSGLQRDRIETLATIDSRRHHPALLGLAEHLGAGISAFDAAHLEMQTPRLRNPSDALFARIGCHGVAEAAALAAAGDDAVLVLEKTSGRKMTVAIAM